MAISLMLKLSKKHEEVFYKRRYICTMGKNLKIISSEYLEEYSSQSNLDWLSVSDKLKSKSNFTTEDFEYYIIASSLFFKNRRKYP
jgi:hypothetical protein